MSASNNPELRYKSNERTPEGGVREILRDFFSERDPTSGGYRPIMTNSEDMIDLTFINIPTGEIIAPAYEALAAGDIVNVFDDSGTRKVRKADASALDKPAHGYVIANYDVGETVGMRVTGECPQALAAGTGMRIFLSGTTPGKASATVDDTWVLHQQVGFRAPGDNSFVFQPFPDTVNRMPT